jgi:hypothetical protein
MPDADAPPPVRGSATHPLNFRKRFERFPAADFPVKERILPEGGPIRALHLDKGAECFGPIAGRLQLGLKGRHAHTLSTLAHAQDIGDYIAQIAAFDDHVGHSLMRSSKRSSQGCAVHSGCVGNVLESWSDEIG